VAQIGLRKPYGALAVASRGTENRGIRRRVELASMPIYEYQCEKCRKRTSVLTMRVSERVEAICKHCGSARMRRLMSRFATPRSEESRMDALSNPAGFSDVDENDPKSIARALRKMGKEMGDEMGGPEFDEAVDQLESGGGLDDDGGDDGGSGGADDL
jgi:putative FmdB family regulatory protein